MVSFWPWRADDSSPASFEKALSAVATKITATQAQIEKTRAASRRVRVLWTLYLSFAYLVYAIVLVLVVGWKNMGQWEWTGIAGGPILIYTTRTILTAFFNYRLDSLETKLRDQQAERAKTIQKLKDATKYDSTAELLAKYGGVEGKSGKDKAGKGQGEGGQGPEKGQGPHAPGSGGPRTGLPPPPTANIPRGPGPVPPTGTPKGRIVSQAGGATSSSPARSGAGMDLSAEFAPNAFGPGDNSPGRPMPNAIPNAQYAAVPSGTSESHWYDRVMDLLLGEDETAAKNRIVLICKQCRLINGQAPPGTRSLSELGMWKCMACGSMNGEVDEGKRIMREVLGKKRAATPSSTEDVVTDGESGSFVDAGADVEEDEGKSLSADAATETKQPDSHRELRKRKGKASKQ